MRMETERPSLSMLRKCGVRQIAFCILNAVSWVIESAMFPAAYFGRRYFPARYWPVVFVPAIVGDPAGVFLAPARIDAAAVHTRRSAFSGPMSGGTFSVISLVTVYSPAPRGTAFLVED